MANGWRTQLTRQVGEHLIAAELGRRNYAAAPFAGNVPLWDLLAADESGYVVPIQVKTINGASWQFSVSGYLKVEITEQEQIVHGLRDLLNPTVVCVLVMINRSPPDDYYVFRLSHLQAMIAKDYRPRKLPKNVKSLHWALWPQEVEEFKNRWDILDDAFAQVRLAQMPGASRISN